MNHSFPDLCIYLEDAPVVASCPATGLSKALLPMLRELAGCAGELLVVQTHAYFDPSQIDTAGMRAVRVAGRLQHRIARVIERLPFGLALAGARLHGLMLGRRFRGRARGANPRALWTAIGVDPLSLVRAAACAETMRLQLQVYLVDDIETHPANAGRAGLHAVLRRALLGAQAIHTITPELGARCEARYGVRTAWLPLTADIPVVPERRDDVPPTYFAAYLGSVNHLYEEGLRLLVAVVSELRERHRRELMLRIIAPEGDVVRALGRAAPGWVVCGVEREQASLGKVLADSQFCYLPYSHADAARVMVGSSYPSKLLDYLAWAREIVVYAPKGSVPYNFFERDALEFRTDSEAELRQHLERLVLGRSDHATAYRQALGRHHGPGRATQVILRGVEDTAQ